MTEEDKNKQTDEALAVMREIYPPLSKEDKEKQDKMFYGHDPMKALRESIDNDTEDK
jgi:hypothetical protein